ncbi:cyclase family protein [Myxococcus sp. K15C18031901]|uniref:cyclase family protein n=1 Tax=Myxococcus dinghuensis TaxID=2906761 RepID=UPI0020A71E9D|nr:cyclase family protein [Myxococcus dinghuensis]MCP3098896.1 cyclase family protein [Myxococcus dinghuensis]
METAATGAEMREGGHGWVDVSVPLRDGMLHWPDNPEIRVTRAQDMARGDAANVSHLSLGAHSGTHVDAPIHFIPEGVGVDALPLEATVGVARVLAIQDARAISVEALRRADVQAGERLLFKTANSSRHWASAPFRPDFVCLSVEGARYLAERRVRTVGIDYLSIGSPEAGAPTHQTLLRAGIVIIEGLDLSAIEPGTYDLVCLPLRLEKGDGAPARAILRRR